MNIIEGLQEEMNRVREVITIYEGIGLPGMMAAGGMKADIREAEKCIAEGDTIGMMAIYKELQKWEC